MLRRRRHEERADDLGTLVAFAVPALVASSLHVPPVAIVAAVWAARVVRRDATAGRTITLGRPLRPIAAAVALGLLFAATPGALGSWAMQRAAALRAARDLEGASRAAAGARERTPWSRGAAMLDESLRYLRGEPVLEVGDRLIALAERYPLAPDPVARVAWLLEHQVSEQKDAVPLWRDVAHLYEQAAERDPHNALRWCEVGRTYARAQDWPAAERAWGRALVEEPHCATALAQLALRALDRDDKALAHDLAARAQTADRHGQGSRGYVVAVLNLPPSLRHQLTQRELLAP